MTGPRRGQGLQEGEEGVQAAPTEAITACGSRLQDPEGYPRAVHRGRTVYFCHEACREAFDRDPDRFVAGEIEHPKPDGEAQG